MVRRHTDASYKDRIESGRTSFVGENKKATLIRKIIQLTRGPGSLDRPQAPQTGPQAPSNVPTVEELKALSIWDLRQQAAKLRQDQKDTSFHDERLMENSAEFKDRYQKVVEEGKSLEDIEPIDLAWKSDLSE